MISSFPLIPILVTLPFLVLLYIFVVKKNKKKKKKNVFFEKYPEYDKEPSEEISKQSYVKSEVPDDIDYIIIGSGMGSLTCASILAKNGNTVVVLEQAEIAGGCSHSFEKEGYEFSAGVHALATYGKGEFNTVLLEYITDGRAKFERFSDVHDIVYDKMKKTEVVSTEEDVDELPYMKQLIKEHPDEEESIREFFKTCRHIANERRSVFILRALPKFLQMICKPFMAKYTQKYYQMTIKEGLDKFFKSDELKVKLGYLSYYVGEDISVTPFVALLLIDDIYSTKGTYAPVNGSGSIVKYIISTIEKRGGKVFTNARVEKIIMSTKKGRAAGVKLVNGDIIRSKRGIVSGTGVYYTEKMLPKIYQRKNIVSNFNLSESTIIVFCGFNENYKKLNLPESNVHIWNSLGHGKIDFEKFIESDEEFPCLFVSFPNKMLKRVQERNKSVCELIALCKNDWFKKWKDLPPQNRGSEYEDLKEKVKEKILKMAFKRFPQMEAALDFCEIGTSVSVNHWLGKSKGEIYGALLDKERLWKFGINTKMKNVYNTGVDTFYLVGYTAAVVSGVITAQSLLGESITSQAVEKVIFEKKKMKAEKKHV